MIIRFWKEKVQELNAPPIFILHTPPASGPFKNLFCTLSFY